MCLEPSGSGILIAHVWTLLMLLLLSAPPHHRRHPLPILLVNICSTSLRRNKESSFFSSVLMKVFLCTFDILKHMWKLVYHVISRLMFCEQKLLSHRDMTQCQQKQKNSFLSTCASFSNMASFGACRAAEPVFLFFAPSPV